MVPYNCYLLKRFDCHFNAEICGGIKCIKYVHKYVYKGHDRAMVNVQPAGGGPPQARPQQDQQQQDAAGRRPAIIVQRDEIQMYEDCRYVSAAEAAWRLFAFPLHREQPNVVRLQVHLPDMQHVLIDTEEGMRQTNFNTTLTAWFAFNEAARRGGGALWARCSQAKYHDIPKIATWDKKAKVWRVRQ